MGGAYQSPQWTQAGQPAVPVQPVGAREAGFGDIVASVGYRLVDRVSDGVQVAITARAKLPTAASSRGLGTGRADYGVTTIARKRFTEGWVYGEVGYIALGDPEGVELRNAVLWSAGGGRRLTGRLYALVSASGNSAILPEFGVPAEVGAGLGVRVSDQFSVTLLPSVGLSDASPAFAFTAGISTTLGR